MSKMYSEVAHNKFNPHTIFGKAVAESGFGRVCPGCFKKWSNRPTWIHETLPGESVLTSAGRCGVRVCNCGGMTLTEGRSEMRQAEKETEEQKKRAKES